MGCQHLEEVYELFLLGTLPAQEGGEVRAHLERGCPNCLERVREAGKSIYLLAQMARPRRLHPKWKSRLLRRLRKRR
jgi:anti-sigma factor RsiW